MTVCLLSHFLHPGHRAKHKSTLATNLVLQCLRLLARIPINIVSPVCVHLSSYLHNKPRQFCSANYGYQSAPHSFSLLGTQSKGELRRSTNQSEQRYLVTFDRFIGGCILPYSKVPHSLIGSCANTVVQDMVSRSTQTTDLR